MAYSKSSFRSNLVKLHFILLPFGGLNFGSSYFGVNFITSILINLVFGLSFFKLFQFQQRRRLTLYLLLFWAYMLTIGFLNFRTDVVTPNSELRMLSLYVVTFFNLLHYFNRKPTELYVCIKYLCYSVIVLCCFAILGINVQYEESTSRLSVLGMNPNYIAYFVVFAFTFFFNNLLVEKSEGIKFRYAAILVLFFAVFLKLGSLSALGMLFISVSLLFILRNKSVVANIKSIFLSAALILSLYAVVTNSKIFSGRLNDKEAIEDLSGRKELWELALTLIEKNTWFGIGNYESAYTRLRQTGVEISFHNVYLEVLVSGGIMAFSLLLLYLYVYFRKAWVIRDSYTRPLVIASFFITVISVFSGQFSFFFFTTPLLIVLKDLPDDFKVN